MRRIAFMVVGVALFAATSSSYAGTRTQPLRSCAPRRAKVLLGDHYAQVYEYRFGVYTCLRHSTSVQYLGHTEANSRQTSNEPMIYCATGAERCGSVSLTALAGRVVAYVESRLELAGRPPEQIVVRSVSTGRVLHAVPVEVATVQRTMIEQALVLDIAVDDTATVAWTQEDHYARHRGGASPPTVYDVFAIDNSGFQSLRTELPNPPQSLKLFGSRLSWLQEGMAQSTQVT